VRNDFQAWVALQGKPEAAAENVARVQSSRTGHSQEGIASMAFGLESSTSANITSASPNSSAPLRPGELVFQVAERIQVQLRDGKSEIRIQLRPENLGYLEIRAEATSNGVVARITAESASIKNYLENNLHLLQQNLQDQGLKIERIQIVVQEALNQQSSSGQSPQFGYAGSGGKQWSETHKSPQASGVLFSDLSDEIDVDPLTLIAVGSPSRFNTVA
jgi:flagellar hook-length control protein FliK